MAEISLRNGIVYVTLPLSELAELVERPVSRDVTDLGRVAPPPPPGVYKAGRYRTVPVVDHFDDGSWGSRLDGFSTTTYMKRDTNSGAWIRYPATDGLDDYFHPSGESPF